MGTPGRTAGGGVGPALLLAVASLACTKPSGGPSVERDSAGVRIVESTRPAWGESRPWLIDSIPTIDLTKTSPSEFTDVVDARRSGNGRFVVADGGSQEIRVYSPAGTIQWKAGRKGDGPGDFNRLANVDFLRGDSIVAFDYWLGRATIFGPDGRLGRLIVPYQAGPNIKLLYPIAPSGFVALLDSYELMPGTTGPFRIPAPVARVSAAGAVRDTITVLPGFETYVFSQGDARPLFGRRAHLATRGSEIVVGTANELGYAVYSETGHLAKATRVLAFDLRLTSDQIAAERASYLGANPPQSYRDLIASLPSPSTRPAFSQLLVDPTGSVWLAPFNGGAEPDRTLDWQVFDSTGTWLGPVRFPPRLHVTQIELDAVLGVRRDSLDVEHVVLFRVRGR